MLSVSIAVLPCIWSGETAACIHRHLIYIPCSNGFAGNPSSLGCGMGGLPQHVTTSGGQLYQQQVHQGMQPQGVASHSAYQGQQHFSDNPPYTDSNSTNAGSMSCLYQNYQVGQD